MYIDRCITYGSSVDKDNDDNNQQYDHNGADNVPLVVLPDDELEGLPWRREPEEGGRWTVRRIKLRIEVRLVPGLGRWAELLLLL